MHFPISVVFLSLGTKMQSQFTEFDLNILNSGIYIVVLSNKNGSLNQDIVKE
ncbi:MAG: hypothetical protein DRI98_14435 [Bacteroidetes bacterium]|nr:MAG: hypothetical protein DRI98_14435 [Bacteroidota bacterium]